jgi:pyrroloquinoline quinone biosynthesis protein D
MTALSPGARPRLARGVRLHEDKVRGGWSLLAPERSLQANPSAVEVLKLCDGQRSFAELVDQLADKFSADRARIEQDATVLLRDLEAKRMLNL